MRVIGTAGHVDHGKSTLVKRLTDMDPDRLAEEKNRQMTIDLGFAWMPLPNGMTVGIVDVPGHRDFIENMLAGVGGIDAVLLVIAADEGIMPQTREHLAIVDLLAVSGGLVAMTKIDMLEDSDWIDLVEQDIRDAAAGTILAGADIVRVSAHTGQGVVDLVKRLERLLSSMPERANNGFARLPIDRVFTMSGFGTVVTGTLLGGPLYVGDEVECQPAGVRGRIRGLQSYKQSVEKALPGSRVAVNISGVDKTFLTRGQVLSYPGYIQPTLLADAYLRYLPDMNRALDHNIEVKFFCGTAETTARVRLLDAERLAPGAQGWVQLRLDRPMPLCQGDRFILRLPSPPQTLGGGIVIAPHPGKRWKRFHSLVIQQLETQMRGSPAQRLAQVAERREPVTRHHLQVQTGFTPGELDAALQECIDTGLLTQLAADAYMATVSYQHILRRANDLLIAFHKSEPLRPGMPREELRSRLGIKIATLSLLLDSQTDILSDGSLVRLAGHRIRFTEKQQARVDQLAALMAASPFTPPSYGEAASIVGDDVLGALIDTGEIVRVQQDIIFSRTAYDGMVQTALVLIDATGSVDARSLRDHCNTSRKYAIGLLEHLDSLGITRRVGDARVRGGG